MKNLRKSFLFRSLSVTGLLLALTLIPFASA